MTKQQLDEIKQRVEAANEPIPKVVLGAEVLGVDVEAWREAYNKKINARRAVVKSDASELLEHIESLQGQLAEAIQLIKSLQSQLGEANRLIEMAYDLPGRNSDEGRKKFYEFCEERRKYLKKYNSSETPNSSNLKESLPSS